jgi:cytosine/adenosine deaminase-related metal-dependent hydrolase
MRATLYSAAWVLPVSSAPIAHGAVLVDERGIIREVAPREAIAIGDDIAHVDLGDAILLPGLINVHAHPELAAMRGLLEDLPFHLWIPALRRAKDGAALAPADFITAAHWTCIESVAAGVTTMGATEDSGAALQAMRETGMRGVVYREVFAPAPEHAHTALQALRAKVDGMRELETDLVRVGVSPHAPYTVSDELFRLIAAYATTESLPVAVHTAESEAEQSLVARGDGPFAAGLRTRGIATPPRARSTIALLDSTGILATRPLLIHCVRIDAQDIARIGDSDARVAHCPVANARLGHGTAPLVELREAGAVVGIGSDSVAANNRIDILEEARIAQLVQRARLQSAGALAAPELLRLTTIDGARALGLDARVGTLEAGKEADLCAVQIGAPHTWPVNDPVAALFMSARGSDVVLTTVRGAVLYRAGRQNTITDIDSLRTQLADHAARMRAARDRM